MAPEAFEQIEGNRLFDRPLFPGGLRFGIELLAVVRDRVIERAEGGDSVDAERRLFFSSRLA